MTASKGGAAPSDFQAHWIQLIKAYRADRLPDELQAVKARAAAAAAVMNDDELQTITATQLLTMWGVPFTVDDYLGPATIVTFVLVDEHRQRAESNANS